MLSIAWRSPVSLWGARHEVAAPSISASGSGCCRGSCLTAHRDSASLSDAAGVHHRRLSPWRPDRHLGKLIVKETEKWGKLIRAANIKVQ